MCEFQTIYDKALKAANVAIKAYQDEHGDPIYCGFAWVAIHPARGAFVNWLKKNDIGSPGYPKGYQIWSPGEYNGQSMDIKEVGAEAFAKVLRENGINAHMSSRAD